jgi:salicylate hydroxylase
MKAIIVGGGIGGVAAAVALRRMGIECDVFEQAEELREVGSGQRYSGPEDTRRGRGIAAPRFKG